MKIIATKLPFKCHCVEYLNPDTGGAWLMKNTTMTKYEFEEALKNMFGAEIQFIGNKKYEGIRKAIPDGWGKFAVGGND